MSKRLDYIDGLRGIAAITVVVQHCLEYFHSISRPGSAEHEWLNALLCHGVNLGRFGVVLFFLISGCVIPFSLKGENALRSFAISRFFRLYPAYWLCIFGGALIGAAPWTAPFTPWQVAINATMVQHFLRVPSMYGHLWTLGLELTFYAACALLYAMGLLRSPRVLAAITIALTCLGDAPFIRDIVLGHNQGWFSAFLTFLPYLFLGSLIRSAMIDGDPQARMPAIIAGAFVLFSIPLICNAFMPQIYFGFLSPMPASMGFLCALVVFVIAIRLQGPRAAWAVNLGKISYSVYLFHAILLEVAIQLLPKGSPIKDAAFLLIVVAAAIVVATASYHFIERPAIAMGRKLAHRRKATLAEEVAP